MEIAHEFKDHPDKSTPGGPSAMGGPVLQGCDLAMSFGAKRVFEGVNVTIQQGEVLAIVGGSGSGKSTLMRQLALLQTPTSGSVTVFGTTVTDMESASANSLRRRLGVMFQNGALFGDLTVLENVSVPLQEHTDLSPPLIEQVAMLKIALAGLEPEAAALYPSQLSGGMRKRAAVARGIALDPAVLFLDEPSSGLDPISADAMDELVVQLKETLGLAVVLVTHDMDSLWRVADRILLLSDGRVAVEGTIHQLVDSGNAAARQFFHSRRGRASGAMYD
jgi:phospholipid/cholesterol/gamma-HCH transport system ATP-binding protein